MYQMTNSTASNSRTITSAKMPSVIRIVRSTLLPGSASTGAMSGGGVGVGLGVGVGVGVGVGGTSGLADWLVGVAFAPASCVGISGVAVGMGVKVGVGIGVTVGSTACGT